MINSESENWKLNLSMKIKENNGILIYSAADSFKQENLEITFPCSWKWALAPWFRRRQRNSF